MRTVEVAGRKILLVRTGRGYDAVASQCPHAGAPLEEGVLEDGLVVCPWHKAAFCVATGRRTEPPAVDDLARYPVRVEGGRVRIFVSDTKPTAVATATDPRTMAIIGAGAAGMAAAQTLRENGFSGRVVLIGEEPVLPYDRTILSKYALSGKKGGEKTPLQDAAYFASHGIERLVRTVRAVDVASRAVKFTEGSDLTYDAALLATGGKPRAATVPGSDLAGIHLLRTPEDAAAIVRSAGAARHAVVMGAGFIGLEAAASLRERGLEVAVVAPERAPLERQLGAEVGQAFRHVHEREGVVFHLSTQIKAFEGDGRVERVRLKDGTALPADMVVVGLGITPVTDLATGCSRDDSGGLEVDCHLRARDNLYAAGDIAAFPLYGNGARIRVEHWRVAEQHGRVAALNMLGISTPYDAVPYFWTIHYLKRLDYVGHCERWDEVVIDGDLAKPEFTAYYVRAGRVEAVAGWARDQQMAKAILRLGEHRRWSAESLRSALTD